LFPPPRSAAPSFDAPQQAASSGTSSAHPYAPEPPAGAPRSHARAEPPASGQPELPLMTKKMFIDATHPEETRVVVVDGQRVDEFDFESAARRQLRGNI
jgi:hypothetical protein